MFRLPQICKIIVVKSAKLSSALFFVVQSYVCLYVPPWWQSHLSPLYDVLDHTSHMFSESWWRLFPVTFCPLTNSPINYKTHPPSMKISPHDTNQICACRLLFSTLMTTHPLPSESWHSEFRTVVRGLVTICVICLICHNGHCYGHCQCQVSRVAFVCQE